VIKLEILGARALIARFGEHLGFEKTQLFSQKLPFLKGTLIANEICPEKIHATRWPKMVELQGAAKSSDRMSDTEVMEWKKKIQQFFDGVISSSININMMDWSSLFEYLLPDVLYIPAPQSRSADAFLTIGEKCMLLFQWKNVDKFSITDLVDEIKKVVQGVPPTRSATFVIGSRTVGDDICKNVAATPVTSETDGRIVAHHFKHNSTIKYGGFEQKLPAMVDVIVLSPDIGLPFLLGESNASLLKPQNYKEILETISNKAMKRAASFKEAKGPKKLKAEHESMEVDTPTV